ncbi:MAG TPA: GNAT family protein [Actinokineospora sp.]|nr:GNAT family protein [Actinokineospora sp.]
MFAIPLRGDAELRAIEPWHAEEFLAHIDRARTHIAPWVGAGFVVSDLDGARALLQRYADGQAADRRRLYGIWLDGTLVGGTMFVSFDTAHGVCEIGCWLEPSAEGRGLIAQVVRMMIDWAFQVRGLARVEWRTQPANTRSANVAKRLGMSLDGTLRQVVAGAEGVRRDQQVWSVLATEWSEETKPADVKAELDRLTHAFLGAFTNTAGRKPDLDAVRDLFIPQGMIIKNVGGEPVIDGVDTFIAPRRTILTDGTLAEFSEWETAERTEIRGTVAQRFSHYRKSGYRNGEWFEGAGHKTIQFVKTPDGWRISSLAWDDV